MQVDHVLLIAAWACTWRLVKPDDWVVEQEEVAAHRDGHRYEEYQTK